MVKKRHASGAGCRIEHKIGRSEGQPRGVDPHSLAASSGVSGRFYREAYGRAVLAINIYLDHRGHKDNRFTLFSQIPFSNDDGFNRLIHRAGANGLYFNAAMIPIRSGDSSGNCGGA